jgi:hypothetical protein
MVRWETWLHQVRKHITYAQESIIRPSLFQGYGLVAECQSPFGMINANDKVSSSTTLENELFNAEGIVAEGGWESGQFDNKVETHRRVDLREL